MVLVAPSDFGPRGGFQLPGVVVIDVVGVLQQVPRQHGDDIGMVTHPGPINMEHELLVLQEDMVVTTPSYHLFKMFREHGGADIVECAATGVPVLAPMECPALRACCSVKRGGREATLSVINLALSDDLDARFAFEGRRVERVQVQTLACEDIHAENSAAAPSRVSPAEQQVTLRDGGVEHEFPAHSVTVFRLGLAG